MNEYDISEDVCPNRRKYDVVIDMPPTATITCENKASPQPTRVMYVRNLIFHAGYFLVAPSNFGDGQFWCSGCGAAETLSIVPVKCGDVTRLCHCGYDAVYFHHCSSQ